MIAGLLTALTAAAVAALLWAVRTQSQWSLLIKMAAATGFVAVGLAVGATESAFGRIVLGALALSWIGDLLLSYADRRAFFGGLGAFLVAHLVYVVAFLVRGISSPHPLEPVTIGAVSLLAVRWLLPHVEQNVRGPVIAYIVAITAMVILAGATAEFDADARLRVGALLFYASDLAVARERFVTPGFVNRAMGLPLYFAGQLLLAWAAGG